MFFFKSNSLMEKTGSENYFCVRLQNTMLPRSNCNQDPILGTENHQCENRKMELTFPRRKGRTECPNKAMVERTCHLLPYPLF